MLGNARTGAVTFGAVLWATALLLAASATVVSASHAEPAPYRCYELDCSWGPTSEESFVHEAEAQGGVLATPGPLFSDGVAEVFESGHLQVERDVVRWGTAWDILVIADTLCDAVLTIEEIAIPGYESAWKALENAPGVHVVDDAYEVRSCHQIYAGFPQGSTTLSSGGQLRLQAGAAATLDANFTLDPQETIDDFPFWAGILPTLSLGLHVADDALHIELGLQARVLLEGDLGWRSGSMLVPVFEVPVHRSFVLTPAQQVGACDGEPQLNGQACAQVGPQAAAASAGLSVGGHWTLTELHEASNGWTDPAGHDPLKSCLSLGVSPYYCQRATGLALGITAPLSARADSALKENNRIDPEEDEGELFVESCLKADPVYCTDGGAGAFRISEETIHEVTASDLDEELDRSASELIHLADAGGLAHDLERWVDAFSGNQRPEDV